MCQVLIPLAYLTQSVCTVTCFCVPVKFSNNAAHLVEDTRDVMAANCMKNIVSVPGFNNQRVLHRLRETSQAGTPVRLG